MTSMHTKGPNDEMFAEHTETFQQTSSIFAHPGSFPYKPIRLCEHAPMVYYPAHPYFRSRIDINAWAVFNADLNEALYSEAYPCLCLAMPVAIIFPPISLLATYRSERNDKLYEIVAHYNKVLFHPMLIDAQVLVFSHYVPGSRDSPSHTMRVVNVSFLVARDGAHFRSFARPVVGLSSGYTPFSAPMCPCLTKPVDYHLDPNPEVPDRVPAKAPAFDTLYPVTPAMVARMLKTPDHNPMFWAPSHLQSERQQFREQMLQEWAEFFEFRTDRVPTRGWGKDPIPIPPVQSMLMSVMSAPEHPPMVPTPQPPVVEQGYEIPMVAYPTQAKTTAAQVMPVGYAYQPIER